MNLGQVARLLAGFTLFFSLSLVVPLLIAINEQTELGTQPAFVAALSAGLTTALLLWLAGRRSSKDFYRKEGLAVVGLAWVLAGVLAATPLVLSGAIPNPADALFEGIAGLTTTGATVLQGDPDNPKAVGYFVAGEAGSLIPMPQSILLWRAMIQWIGGLGIILVFIVLLPSMGITGSRLLSSEQVGVSSTEQRPRLQDQARQLFAIYVLLTAAAGTGYWVAGMPVFDALCHAFTTCATAGFSTRNGSIGSYQSPGIELVAIVFMFLAGCNFLLLVRAFTRGSRAKSANVLQRTEFRVYFGITLTVITALTLVLWFWGQPIEDPKLGITREYGSLGRCARDAAFQTMSLLTSTGYCSADYQNWPKPAVYLLLLCMFLGACTGSTAGGFKVLRVVVCTRLIGYTLRQFVRPRSVEKLKIGTEVIPNHIVSAILALLLLWIGGVAAGTLVLCLDPNMGLVSAFTTSVSMMGCVGPSISEVEPAANGTFELVGQTNVGPYGGYAALHPLAKLFMALQMILGRLEILAPLVLLTPSFWRR